MSGRLGEGSHHELRIHGVAGTPPEGMLDDLAPAWPAADACGQPPKGAALTVWRRLPKPPGLRAYSWSSVTSGSARSALYLLLVPHLLVNMAGWSALPSAPPGSAGMDGGRPVRGWSVRLVTAGVRLLALALTVIMAQWALLVALDLFAYQWAVRIHQLPPWTLAVGVLAAGVAMELVLLVTRLRLRTEVAAVESSTPLTDPVGYAWLTTDQHLLWGSPRTIALQRHAHHGVALGSVALVGVAMVGGWVAMPQPWVTLGGWLGGLAIVMGVLVVLQHSLSSGRVGQAGWGWLAEGSRLAGRLGLVLAAVAAGRVTLTGPPPRSVTPAMVEGLDRTELDFMATAGQPVFLPVVRDLGMGLTLGYTAAALAVGLLAWLVRHRDVASPGALGGRDGAGRFGVQGFNVPGLALLGGAVGGGMGAALAAASSRVLSSQDAVVVPGPLPEALAITFATLAVLLGWVVVVSLAVHTRTAAQRPDRPAPGAGAARPAAAVDDGEGSAPTGGAGGRTPPVSGRWRVVLTTAVHRLLRRGSWLSATLTCLGVLGVGMVVLLVGSPDNPLHVLQGAEPLPQIIVMVAVGLVATTVGLAIAVLSGRRRIAAAAGVILVIAAAAALAQVPGDDLLRQLRPVAMAIGLLTPAGFVAGKGISALRRTSDRRTIAILWDVGTFLPRWFDPLSPPTYGDRVVTDLQDLIGEQLTTPASDGQDRTLLLSPHSQGTVIAAAAVLGLPPTAAGDPSPGAGDPAPAAGDPSPAAAAPAVAAADPSAGGMVPRLALLTYGSPLRHLYAEFFPRLFDHAAFTQLQARVGGCWRNLARTSDPIGAPVGIPAVDLELTHDPCARGHSAYPRETAYDNAVSDLQAGLESALGPRTVLRIPEAAERPPTGGVTPRGDVAQPAMPHAPADQGSAGPGPQAP